MTATQTATTEKTSNTATTGKGMPAKTPQQAPQSQVNKPVTPQDASVEASLALPHERDQSTDMTAEQPDREIKQASIDVKRGIKDTSKSTETDQAYQKLR